MQVDDMENSLYFLCVENFHRYSNEKKSANDRFHYEEITKQTGYMNVKL